MLQELVTSRDIDLIDHYKQKEKYGYCGPACMQMAFSALGIKTDQDTLAEIGGFTEWGIDHVGLKRIADRYAFGFQICGQSLDVLARITTKYTAVLNIMDLDEVNPNVNEDGHYVVSYLIDSSDVYFLDPSTDQTSKPRKMSRKEFNDIWWDIDKDGKIIREWALIVIPKPLSIDTFHKLF